ncbi:ShlB/FhaC/HecB family hemolysin secretion/activation protein [Trinickia caryophylli]|uniref:ShlB/FhaC/HecB family hemolysin secretion/activation protein n=1 Tax=Trinickia caryophylli TaxID=28094 RepID=UPI001E49EDF6|nr:ShlB/FhaC/HecB family hemolysin secretion/activation protein [Trinickia caryophylli]WQE15371.1 ShlB/FhaC/HecB family hemolysin secretion/activation protein [Trinickia caryophylli]GLU33894.1 activator/secretion protein [Trinickia caryophylli]
MKAIALVCGAIFFTSLPRIVHAQAAAAQPPLPPLPPATRSFDEQEQRRRAEQQQLERERAQRAPNVQLQPQPEAKPVDDGRVPAETPCFRVDRLTLAVPDGLSEKVRAAGERALSPDPLFPGQLSFAVDYLKRYEGQCVGRDGLNLIVHRVSALILDRGYTTTRVVIPEQDISTGKLTLSLIPGVIGAIRFADPKTYGTWRNAFPTHAGHLLNLRDLEQGLEQMKRVPNQDVDMQIVPGANTGESDVVIAVKRQKPWTFSLSVDDSGLKSTGQLQATAHLGLSNLLGLSDILDVSYSHDVNGHPGLYGTRGQSAFYAIPWGNWTFTATASKYHYHQEIAGAFANFVSSGISKTFEVKAEYLFYRNQVQKNSIEFRTGKYYAEAFIDGSEIDVQHRDNSYAQVGWSHRHYFGAAQFDSLVSYRWGVPWFGAQPDLPGAGTPTYYYHIETLDATLSVPFALGPVRLRYLSTLHAQNSPNVLYPTEDISIGSRYTVRGFDGNTMLAAEKGFYLRNDLEMPIFRTGQTLYVGLDGGEVFGPATQNLLGRKLVGAVVGLRGSPFKNAYYDVFIGGPLYQPARFPNRWPVAGFSVSFQI